MLQDHLVDLQVSTAGGFVRVAQVTNFPVSTEMSGALVRFAPGALRQLHWHPGHAEWQYVINGSLTVRKNRRRLSNSNSNPGHPRLNCAPEPGVTCVLHELQAPLRRPLQRLHCLSCFAFFISFVSCLEIYGLHTVTVPIFSGGTSGDKGDQ
jgi:hypothetical protein